MPLVLIPFLAIAFAAIIWLLLASKFDKIGGFVCNIVLKPFKATETNGDKNSTEKTPKKNTIE